MTLDLGNLATYTEEIQGWRERAEAGLRAETGWLTLTGLYWLHEGQNTLGSDETADILLPASAPKQVGFIEYRDGTATLRVTSDAEVTVDGVPTKIAALRDDHDPQNPSRVEIGAVNFIILRRKDQHGVRVRDRDNPARQAFSGREWFPIDPAYRVVGTFVAHPSLRALEIMNSVGMTIPMENPGSVAFRLGGQQLQLEAFSAAEGELWFVFRDANPLAYPAGRFLYAPLQPDGTVILDFNKAYSPPCAFTPYATCPLAPKENILAISIEAGEIAHE